MRSIIFFSILGGMLVGNLLWWRRAYRLARSLPKPLAWRTAIAFWSGTMFLIVVMVVLSRGISDRFINWAPSWLVAAVYIWHVLFALEWLVWRGIVNLVKLAAAGVRRVFSPRPLAESPASADLTLSSRRQFLTAAAVVAPPALVTLAAWRAVSQFDEFRTRSVSLLIPNLPPALEGLRIAHVSDIHIGKFSDDALLRAVVEKTNALKPDLICYTGDLIDYDLADIPAGLAALRKWDPRFGLCLCEGNHDLMTSRPGFEDQVTRAGFPMPINGSHSVTVRGQEIQLLGLRWGGADQRDQNIGNSDEDIASSVRDVVRQINPGAFPILLAHHPHAFDYIGDANVPLTLAGHTHGGQIVFGPIAPAALRFRYISGLYRHPNGRQLFVSNGVGNWFPLRIGAPAEIVDITLRGA